MDSALEMDLARVSLRVANTTLDHLIRIDERSRKSGDPDERRDECRTAVAIQQLEVQRCTLICDYHTRIQLMAKKSCDPNSPDFDPSCVTLDDLTTEAKDAFDIIKQQLGDDWQTVKNLAGQVSCLVHCKGAEALAALKGIFGK